MRVSQTRVLGIHERRIFVAQVRPLRPSGFAKLALSQSHRFRNGRSIHPFLRVRRFVEIAIENLCFFGRRELVVSGVLEKRAFVVILLHEAHLRLFLAVLFGVF